MTEFPNFHSYREPTNELTNASKRWFSAATTHRSRLNLVLDPRMLFAFAVGDAIMVLSVATIQTDADGNENVIGLLGTNLSSNLYVKIPAERFTADLITLVSQNDAISLDLSISDVSVEDVTLANGDQGGLASLHWTVPDTGIPPVACRLACVCPLPPTIDVHHGHRLSADLPAPLLEYEPLRIWFTSLKWTVTYNESHSLHHDGILGAHKFDDENAPPVVPSITLINSFTTWYPTPVYSGPELGLITATAQSRSSAITSQHRLTHGTTQATGAAGGGDLTVALTTMMDGFKEIHKTTINSTTATESESARTALNAVNKWKLLLGGNHEVDGETIGVPAELSESFLQVLEAKSIATSLRTIQDDVESHRQTQRSLHPRDTRYTGATIGASSFDRALVNLIKGPSFATGNTKIRPVPALQHGLSVFHFLSAYEDSPEWLARGTETTLLNTEDNLDTPSAKRRKATTEAYLQGRQSTKSDLLVFLSNMIHLLEWMLVDPHSCALYTYMVELSDYFHSPDTEDWWRVVSSNRYVVHNLISSVQRVFQAFVSVATDTDYRREVALGNTLPKGAYTKPHNVYETCLSDIRSTVDSKGDAGDFGHISPSWKFFFPEPKGNGKNDGTKGNSGNNNNNNANNGGAGNSNNNKGKSNSGSDNKASTSSAKTPPTPGFLVYTGRGRLPYCTINFGTADAPKMLCANTAIANRGCKWGSECKNMHFHKYSDIPAASRNAMKEFVEKTTGLDWATGHGPNSPSGTA